MCVSRILGHLERVDAPAQACEAARRLGEDGAVAIVAAHQPKLFGGPLFVALKAATVLALCERLAAADPGRAYVPIFWNGSEDHNAAEFAHATIFEENHDLVHLDCTLGGDDGRMPSALPGSAASEALDEVAGTLPKTEFRNEVVALLRQSGGATLSESFSRLLLSWYGERGLVVVEPQTVRPLGVDVLCQALRRHGEVRECIGGDTEAMEASGFTAPLPVPDSGRSLVYRVGDGGTRHRLRRVERGFVAEGLERAWAEDEILAEVRAAPERFSPAAALRPVVQAASLPCPLFVAGGGELAYHLQLRKLFGLFGQSMPRLVPRAAATVLKPSLVKTMRRMGLRREDLLSESLCWDDIRERGAAGARARSEAFEVFGGRVGSAFDELASELRAIGHDRLGELDRERERFLHRIEALAERFEEEDPRTGADARRRFHRLRKFVLPADSYQELTIATAYFQACFGVGFPDALVRHIDPFASGHHLLEPA
jgi:bacillithiol biosynthesis cysteine-adding enzyme BshC